MDEFESGIEKIADSIGDLITGVPAPIRRKILGNWAAKYCNCKLPL